MLSLTTAQRYGDFCVMIYGSPNHDLLQHCCETFGNVVVHGEIAGGGA